MKQVDAKSLRLDVASARSSGKTIGFVPTMGALHEGHLSLIRRARTENDVVVVSIFVNPLQFGPREDLASYPRPIEADRALCVEAGVDLLFAPTHDEVYPDGDIETRVDSGAIGSVLEGRFRPGFFQGVATVCAKLFNLAAPDRVYFGQKDAQQLAVIRRMVRDLDFPIEIVGCPTVRDSDGLAASSRNLFLSPEERRASLALSRGLFEAEVRARAGDRGAAELEDLVRSVVSSQAGVELQYVEVVDPDSFSHLDRIVDRALIVIAAFVGTTRLIDNVSIDLTHEEGTR